MSIRDQYVFITNKNEEMQCIGIRKGKFEGVVYRYGKVALGEETWDGSLPFRFEYDILENNGIPKERFNDDFFKLIGDILYHIIVVQTPEPEETNESDNRENDIIKPSIQ